MFRWLLRIAIWSRFLWKLSQLPLHLIPTHPDGAGGLGYLEVVQRHFALLVLAISVAISGSFAEEYSSGKVSFEAIYPTLALALIVDFVLVFGPPSVFAFKLRAVQEEGLRKYNEFAARYVNAFEQKWLGRVPSQEPLLGTPDLQSLADLSNSTAIVRSMRWVPVSARLALVVLLAAVLPIVPLFLFEYPVADLAEKLFKKLTGL